MTSAKEIAAEVSIGPRARVSEFPIADLYVDRWSPRSFTDEDISEDTLFTCFEAAHWAPSSFNAQPWRFIYARRHAPAWATFLSFLSSSNRSWASRAAALVLFISKTTFVWDGAEVPLGSHSFDTGAAWSSFAHQAITLGWHTHGMAGFDRERARLALGVPGVFAIEAVVAIGRMGPREALPEKFQAREFPSGRIPTRELVMEGAYRDA